MRLPPTVRAAVCVVALALAASACCKDPPPPPKAPPAPSLIPPLHDAEVGEWVRVQAGVDSEMYRIVAVTDYEVSVEITKYRNETPSEVPRVETWPRNGFGLPANRTVIRGIHRDRIELGGTWYDCWRLEVASHEMGVPQRLYWISEKIPVHGFLKLANVVKGEVDELHCVRLADWGPK